MPQQQGKRRGKKNIGTISSICHSSTRKGTLYSVLRDGQSTTRKSARLSLRTTPIVSVKKTLKRIQKLNHQKLASISSKKCKLSQNESIPGESEQYSLVPKTNHLETKLDKGDSDIVNQSRLQDEIPNTPNPQSLSMLPQCTQSRKAEIPESLDLITRSKARTNSAVLSSFGKSVSPSKLVSDKKCLKTQKTSHDEVQSKRMLRTKQSLLNEKAFNVTEKELPIAECEDGKGNGEPSSITSRLRTRVKSTDRSVTKFSSQIHDAKSSQKLNIAKPTTKVGISKSSTRGSSRISAEANKVKSAIVETDNAKPSTPKSKCTKYATRYQTAILSAEADHRKTTTKSDVSEEGKTDDTIDKSIPTSLSIAVNLTVAEKKSAKFASVKTDSVNSTERNSIAKFSSRSKSGKFSTTESDVKCITQAVTEIGATKLTAVENAAEICTKADGVDTSKPLEEETDMKCGTRGDQAQSVNTVEVKTQESDVKSVGTVHLESTEEYKEFDMVESSKSYVDVTGSSTLETVNTEAGLTECIMKSDVRESFVTETDGEFTGSRTDTVESLRVTIGASDSAAESEIIKCTQTEASCTKSTTRTGTAKSSTLYPNFTLHVGPKYDADTITSKTDIPEESIAKVNVAKCFSTDNDRMETTIESDSVTVPENNANLIKTTAIETKIAKSSEGETEAVILNPGAVIAKSFLVVDTERCTSSKSELEKLPIQSISNIKSPVKQPEIAKFTTQRAETYFAESIAKSGIVRNTAEETGFLKSSTAIVDIKNSKTKDSKSEHIVSATTDSSVASIELALSESSAFVSHIADTLMVNNVAQCMEQEAGSIECTLTRPELIKSTFTDAKSFKIGTDVKEVDTNKCNVTKSESAVLNSGQNILKSSEARAETSDCSVTETDTKKSSSPEDDSSELSTTVHNADFTTRSNIAKSTIAAVDSAHFTTVKSNTEKLTKTNSDVKADALSFCINKSDIEKPNAAKNAVSESFKNASAANSPGVDIEKSFSLEKDDFKMLSVPDVEKSSSTAKVDITISPPKTGLHSSNSEGEIAKVDVKNIPIANANTSELVSSNARDNTDIKCPGSNARITPISVTNIGKTVVTTTNDEMTSITIADIEMTSITTSSTGCTSVKESVAGISIANVEVADVSPATLRKMSDITTNSTTIPTTTANMGMIIMPTNKAKMAEIIAADSTLRSVTLTSPGMKSFTTSGIKETPTTRLSTGEMIYTTASFGERAVTTASIRETMVTTANKERGVTTANNKRSPIITSTRKITATTARNRNDIVSTVVPGKAKTKTESSNNIQVTNANSETLTKAEGTLKTTFTPAKPGNTAITTARNEKTEVNTENNQKIVSTTGNNQKIVSTTGNNQKIVSITGNNQKIVSTTENNQKTVSTTASTRRTLTSTASTIKTVTTTDCTAKTTVIIGDTGKTKVNTVNTEKTKVPLASTWKTTVITACAIKTSAKTGKTGGPVVKADAAESLQHKTTKSKQELITPVDTESSPNASSLTTTSAVDPMPKTGNVQVTVAKSCSKVKSPIKAPVNTKSKSVEASTGRSVYLGIKKNISKVNPTPATGVHNHETFAVGSSASGVVQNNSSTSSTKVDCALTNQNMSKQLEENSHHGNLNERSVDEPLFNHVVIFANVQYKHHLEKLSGCQVTVITEDSLTFKDVPEVISRNWNKRNNKALWLLPLGIYSHVEFYPNLDCERYKCLCPLTSISYEGNTEPSKEDVEYRISDMIFQAKLLRESVQQELGPKSLVMLVPLMPAAIVQENAFQDHHCLHSVISENFAYSSNSATLCVLHTIYNTLCNYWSSVVSEPRENYLSSVMVKYMNMNKGKNLTYIQSDSNYSFVFKPWLNMMKSVIAQAITYCPRGTYGHPRNIEDLIPNYNMSFTRAVHVNHTQEIIGSSFKQVSQNQARPLFQQIVVLGNRDFPSELKELSRNFPIHFEYKNISFDDIGVNTILKYQKKWQYQTLWFIMSDLFNVITPADYGPKCAMLKCQKPLKVFSLQTCIDHPTCTNNILERKADNAINFVKDFAASLTEHLEENSAVFLAPVSLSYVMWEDPSSLHSHKYLHKVVETSPSIPVVIGQKEDWEEFCIQLKSKWIAMLKSSMSGHIEPLKVMNMYLKSESKILEFVSPIPRARVSFTQDAWNEVIRGLLMYFANAKFEDWGDQESLSQNDSDSASEKLSAVSVTSGKQLNKDIVVSQPQNIQVGVSSAEVSSDTLNNLSVSSVKSQTQFSTKQRESLPATQQTFSPIKWPGGPAEPVAKPPNEPSTTMSESLQVKLQIEPPVKLSIKSNKQQLEPSKLPIESTQQPSFQLLEGETNIQNQLLTELVEPHAKLPGVRHTEQESDILTKQPTDALVKQSTQVPPLKLQEGPSAKLQIETSSTLPAKLVKLSVSPSSKKLDLINNRSKTIDHMCVKSNKNGNGVGNSEKEMKDNYDSSFCEKYIVDISNSELKLIERNESKYNSFRPVSLKMLNSEEGNSYQEDLRKKIQKYDSLNLDGRNEDTCTVFGEQDHHSKKYFLVRASNIDMLPLSVIHEGFLACGAVRNGKFDGEDLLFEFNSVKDASLCVEKLNNIQILNRFLKVKLEDDSYGNAVEKHADGIPERPKNYSQSSEDPKKKPPYLYRKQNTLPSALPTSERQPASKRKSHKRKRNSSSSVDSSSANSSFSPLFLEKSPVQRSSSPDSSSSGFSISSSAERICHNYDLNTMRLFLIEERRLKMELEADYQMYSDIPEAHPKYEESYKAFRAKYYETYADEDMKKYKNFWLSVWKELMNAEHKEEWESQKTRLVQQFEAIAAKKKQGNVAKRKKRKRGKYEDDNQSYVSSAGPTSGGNWESAEEIIKSQEATCTRKGELVSDSTDRNFLFSQESCELEEKRMDDIEIPVDLTTNFPKEKNQSYFEDKCYDSLLTSKNVPEIGNCVPVGGANYVASDKLLTVKESLSHTLALLLELCESLGVLGPAIKIIVQKVMNCGTDTQSALKVLDDENNAIIMKMASEKLKSLSERATGNYKDMLLKGSIQAAKLLEYAAASSQNEKKTCNGIDVEKVAKATMNQDASCIVKFIKNILAYEGVGNPTFEDINEIFLAVSSRHFHMALQS